MNSQLSDEFISTIHHQLAFDSFKMIGFTAPSLQAIARLTAIDHARDDRRRSFEDQVGPVPLAISIPPSAR